MPTAVGPTMTATFSAIARHCFLLWDLCQPSLYIKTAVHGTISFIRFRHPQIVLYMATRKIAFLPFRHNHMEKNERHKRRSS
ncbi:hypothetical protein I656_03047 [Geobacillus sp. WSUCF1]|nr:hypothetical protein I656_03047 [Geobacillus sp. WSUCF1]